MNLNLQNLSNRAMLVSLSISTWTARKHDRKVSKEVAANHHTSERMGNYHKRLLPEQAASYDAVQSASGAARNLFYAQTLPWSDEGSRILTSDNFLPYSQAMQQAQSVFEKAVQGFLFDYSRLCHEAKLSLNGLFVASDYPTLKDLEAKFSFRQNILPLPSGNDFRVNLSKGAVDAIRQQIEADVKQSICSSANDTWQRLQEALLKMSERLNNPGAIYRDTLFTNMEELCDILPRLNLLKDPNLDAAVLEVRKEVLKFRPQQCRESDLHRRQAAAKVDDILAKFQL